MLCLRASPLRAPGPCLRRGVFELSAASGGGRNRRRGQAYPNVPIVRFWYAGQLRPNLRAYQNVPIVRFWYAGQLRPNLRAYQNVPIVRFWYAGQLRPNLRAYQNVPIVRFWYAGQLRPNRRSRSEFVTTSTLDIAIAAPAIIGLSRPATASGMAAVL